MLGTDIDTTFSDALGGLLETQFKRVYLMHEPYFEETTHGTQQSKTLQAMDSIRNICLGQLSALHSSFRLRLSAGVRINRLPQDVLIHIFSMLPLHEVVKATHVCHYWRTVGRNTAALWTDISLSGAAFTSVSQLLALSKAAPVDLRLFRSTSSQPALVTAMLSLNHHMGHLRSLAVVPHSRKPRPTRGVPSNPPEWIVYAAPRLKSLAIWWPSYGDHCLFISVAPGTSHSDFASLVHLDFRGNLRYNDFLPVCKSLDTLRLDVPVDLPMSRLLSLISANTALRRLELHFPKVSEAPDMAFHPWADVTEYTLPDVPAQNTVVICEIVSGDLDAWDSADVDFRLRHEQILFRALSTQHVRLLTITCSPRTLDVAKSLLRDMSTLRHVELRPTEVKVEDDRGFIRLFLRNGTLLTYALATSMDHVYTLRLSLLEWTSFGWGVFGCLEELQLDGTVSQCHKMRAVACPSLRRVTFLLSRYGPHDWDIEDSSPEHEEDALVAITLALTVGRLDAWPRPLQQLTITGDCIARDFTFDTRHTSLVSQIQLTTRPAPSRFDVPIKTLREACSSITI